MRVAMKKPEPSSANCLTPNEYPQLSVSIRPCVSNTTTDANNLTQVGVSINYTETAAVAILNITDRILQQ